MFPRNSSGMQVLHSTSICLESLVKWKLSLVSLGLWVMCHYAWSLPLLSTSDHLECDFSQDIISPMKSNKYTCSMVWGWEEALSPSRKTAAGEMERDEGGNRVVLYWEAGTGSLPPFPPSFLYFLPPLLFFLLRRVSLGTSWLWIHYMVYSQAGPWPTDPTASISQELGLQESVTMPSKSVFFFLVMRMDPKASFVIGKCLTTERHLQLLKKKKNSCIFVLFRILAKQDFVHSPNARLFFF